MSCNHLSEIYRHYPRILLPSAEDTSIIAEAPDILRPQVEG